MMTSERVTLPILQEFGGATRDALIPMLQRVQEVQGYLSEQAIAEIGRYLNLPSSKIYGVATFYNQFRFAPKGKFHLMLCRGTACHVKGSLKLVETVTRMLKLKPGQTTRDSLFSLEVVACMGACGLAPAISINGEMHAKVTPNRLERLIAACRAEVKKS
jgi:NADH-quinone oxidoreductase subunit E